MQFLIFFRQYQVLAYTFHTPQTDADEHRINAANAFCKTSDSFAVFFAS